jgi:hypothetical protein
MLVMETRDLEREIGDWRLDLAGMTLNGGRGD